MGYDDFCRCEPDEFAAACEAYTRQRQADDREQWDRMRILATISIQPHIRRRITPESLLPFPWDRPKKAKPKRPAISKGEQLKRFEMLVEREKKDNG